MKRDYTVEKKNIQKASGVMKLLILRPVRALPKEKTPAILWIHGGGYATGMAGMVYMSRCPCIL